MMRSIAITVAILTAFADSALAQTENQPATPASVVRAARQRHEQLIQARVHGGGTTEDSDADETEDTTSSDGLTDLLGGLLGNTDLLGSLGSLLGGSTSTDTGTGVNVQPNSDDTAQPEFSLEDLLALEESLMGQSQVRKGSTAASKSSSTAQIADLIGAVAAAKQDSRSQTTTPQRSFRSRLFESWAGAVFTALTVAFQQRAFIDLLADQIRSFMPPPASGDGDGTGSGDGDGTGNGGTDGDGDTLEGVVQGPGISAGAALLA